MLRPYDVLFLPRLRSDAGSWNDHNWRTPIGWFIDGFDDTSTGHSLNLIFHLFDEWKGHPSRSSETKRRCVFPQVDDMFTVG